MAGENNCAALTRGKSRWSAAAGADALAKFCTQRRSGPARLYSRTWGRDQRSTRALGRFAPLLARLFPETAPADGRIDSALVDVGVLRGALGLDSASGRLMVKADHALPIAGSIKARGGLYAVLEIAERIALSAGLLVDAHYAALADASAREIFALYKISVGSTGNLGLSVGIMAASLGFSATVHMSAEAKAWKKDRLRARGVAVVEHAGDYAAALAAGRDMAAGDPRHFFIDDEDSLPLLHGYAAAAEGLARQLAEAGVAVDRDRPLVVYLPCGVGGAPTGIALGLHLIFGADVHCFFAEPVESACFLLAMTGGGGRPHSIYDAGLSGITEADGLAVPSASRLACHIARPIIAGVYTVPDDVLLRHLHLAGRDEGMRLEPSAAAGFSGPGMLRGDAGGRAYLAATGLGIHLSQATEVVWTTGGSLVPDDVYRDFDARGHAVEAAGTRPSFIKGVPA